MPLLECALLRVVQRAPRDQRGRDAGDEEGINSSSFRCVGFAIGGGSTTATASEGVALSPQRRWPMRACRFLTSEGLTTPLLLSGCRRLLVWVSRCCCGDLALAPENEEKREASRGAATLRPLSHSDCSTLRRRRRRPTFRRPPLLPASETAARTRGPCLRFLPRQLRERKEAASGSLALTQRRGLCPRPLAAEEASAASLGPSPRRRAQAPHP